MTLRNVGAVIVALVLVGMLVQKSHLEEVGRTAEGVVIGNKTEGEGDDQITRAIVSVEVSPGHTIELLGDGRRPVNEHVEVLYDPAHPADGAVGDAVSRWLPWGIVTCLTIACFTLVPATAAPGAAPLPVATAARRTSCGRGTRRGYVTR